MLDLYNKPSKYVLKDIKSDKIEKWVNACIEVQSASHHVIRYERRQG